MPPPIGKLGQGLAKLWELSQGAYSEGAGALRNIGEAFQELAARNPDYFATSRDLPKGLSEADKLKMLSQKHGVQMEGSTGPQQNGMSDRLYVYPPGRNGRPAIATDAGAAMENMGYGLGPLMKRGGINHDTRLLDFDTSDLGAGVGAGKRIYPALWDYDVTAGCGQHSRH